MFLVQGNLCASPAVATLGEGVCGAALTAELGGALPVHERDSG